MNGNRNPMHNFINTQNVHDADASNPQHNPVIPSTAEIQGMQSRLSYSEQRVEHMERRVNYLENELLRTKLKVDYMSQLHTGKTNMNNVLDSRAGKPEQEDDGCTIM